MKAPRFSFSYVSCLLCGQPKACAFCDCEGPRVMSICSLLICIVFRFNLIFMLCQICKAIFIAAFDFRAWIPILAWQHGLSIQSCRSLAGREVTNIYEIAQDCPHSQTIVPFSYPACFSTSADILISSPGQAQKKPLAPVSNPMVNQPHSFILCVKPSCQAYGISDLYYE